jgi:[ribosomal protein S5]-alanine N-acetyltransferase
MPWFEISQRILSGLTRRAPSVNQRNALYSAMADFIEMNIQTARLTIRPFSRADLGQFRRLLAIPEVPGWNRELDRAEAFLSWHISNYQGMDIIRGVVCFGIFHAQTGEVLGAVGAGEHDDLHEPELFFSLLPSARHKGYATEAAMAVTEWTLSNYEIDYLIGTADVCNTASQRVLERCQFSFVDERELLVHNEKARRTFRYYRRHNSRKVDRRQGKSDSGTHPRDTGPASGQRTA